MIRRPAADPRCWIPIALALCAAVAHAQPRGAARKAAEAFDRGLESKKAGDWDAACVAFEDSERLESSVGAQLNLVICRQRAGRFLDAAALARRARAAAQAKGEQAKVAAADKLLAETEARTPSIVVTVAAGRVAVVAIDGAAVAEDALRAPIPLDPGRHRISIGWDGEAAIESEVHLEDAQRLTIEPPPRRPAAGAGARAIDAPAAAAPPPRRSRALALVVGLGGVAIAGAGGYLLYGAHDLQTQADAICPSVPDCTRPEAQGLNDRAVLRSRIAVGMFAGAGVAIGAAAYLWLRTPAGAPRAEVAITRGGVAIAYAGSF